jgi:hypothetical protein
LAKAIQFLSDHHEGSGPAVIALLAIPIAFMVAMLMRAKGSVGMASKLAGLGLAGMLLSLAMAVVG